MELPELESKKTSLNIKDFKLLQKPFSIFSVDLESVGHISLKNTFPKSSIVIRIVLQSEFPVPKIFGTKENFYFGALRIYMKSKWKAKGIPYQADLQENNITENVNGRYHFLNFLRNVCGKVLFLNFGFKEKKESGWTKCQLFKIAVGISFEYSNTFVFSSLTWNWRSNFLFHCKIVHGFMNICKVIYNCIWQFHYKNSLYFLKFCKRNVLIVVHLRTFI